MDRRERRNAHYYYEYSKIALFRFIWKCDQASFYVRNILETGLQKPKVDKPEYGENGFTTEKGTMVDKPRKEIRDLKLIATLTNFSVASTVGRI